MNSFTIWQLLLSSVIAPEKIEFSRLIREPSKTSPSVSTATQSPQSNAIAELARAVGVRIDDLLAIDDGSRTSADPSQDLKAVR